MTIYFPDLSNYQAGLKIQAGTAVVLAKVTEAANYYDPSFTNFKAQAAKVGAVFGGYHFIWSASAAEVNWVYQHAGKTPLMIDAENPNVRNTVTMILSFVNQYRKLGGIVHLVYMPHWYWEGHLGSPTLSSFAAAKLKLVSSNYTSYSDSGPGWASYGGATPIQWQYSDNFSYGGQHVDFNAFKGTIDQYKRLITTGSITAPAPVPAPVPTPKPTPEPTPVPVPVPAPSIGRKPTMIVCRVDPATVPAGKTWPGWGTWDGQHWAHLVAPESGVNNGTQVLSACGQTAAAAVTYSQWLSWTSGK